MDILRTIQSALGSEENGNKAGIQSSVMDLIGSHNGGIKGLISQFTSGGLGEQVQSWVSKGENLPVTPDQIQKAVGNSKIEKMASNLGIDSGTLSSQLSQYLPMIIDKLTPDGKVPSGGLVEKGLGFLTNLFGKK
jgi:uncharacterized protein YidB (DUF937 family)